MAVLVIAAGDLLPMGPATPERDPLSVRIYRSASIGSKLDAALQREVGSCGKAWGSLRSHLPD